MPISVPEPPEFGAPVPAPRPSPDTLALLAKRRSTPAQALAAPGPSKEEIGVLLRLAARAPDHGKLFPWRFIVLGPAAKAEIADRLRPLAAGQADPGKATAVLAKLVNPPVTVAVISTCREGKIPEWEQRLSAGAVCANLLIAAEAMGYGANWITDWYAYDPAAAAVFGISEGERLAGFIHIGAQPEPSLERARPDLDAITEWRA